MFCNLSTVIKMLLLNAHKLSGTFIFQEQNSVLAHMSGSVGLLHRLSLKCKYVVDSSSINMIWAAYLRDGGPRYSPQTR